jgi:hypothetical protein
MLLIEKDWLAALNKRIKMEISILLKRIYEIIKKSTTPKSNKLAILLIYDLIKEL